MTTTEILTELIQSVPEHELIDCVTDMCQCYALICEDIVISDEETVTKNCTNFIRTINLKVQTYPIACFITTTRLSNLLDVLIVRCIHNPATNAISEMNDFFFEDKHFFFTKYLELMPSISQLN